MVPFDDSLHTSNACTCARVARKVDPSAGGPRKAPTWHFSGLHCALFLLTQWTHRLPTIETAPIEIPYRTTLNHGGITMTKNVSYSADLSADYFKLTQAAYLFYFTFSDRSMDSAEAKSSCDTDSGNSIHDQSALPHASLVQPHLHDKNKSAFTYIHSNLIPPMYRQHAYCRYITVAKTNYAQEPHNLEAHA